MTGYILKTSANILPDLGELYDASPVQLSIEAENQLAIDLSEEDEYLQKKKQEKQKSIANLSAILSLIDVQTCLEKDTEILTVLADQKIVLNKILIQKQTGKKSSFKVAEKKAFSQLQNQVSCLEKSVEKKFETILKTIESNQSAVSSWAQVAAQNSQKITSSTEQKQQEISWAQIAAQDSQSFTNLIEQQSQKQIQKQAQKQDHDSYQARRLILHVKTDI